MRTLRADVHLLGGGVARNVRGHFQPGSSGNVGGVRRGRLPRAVPPSAIEREFTKELWALFDRIRPLFSEFEREFPQLLERAARERKDADEGDRIRELIDEVERKLTDAITPTEVANIAEKFAGRINRHQREQLARQARAALGQDVFLHDQNVPTLVKGFVTENVSLIKNIPREVSSRIEKLATRAVQEGRLHKDVAKELEAEFGLPRERAKLIARDQVGKLYGQINKSRQKQLGIERFIWRTVNDRRVRSKHKALEGKMFEWDNPPKEGIPGQPIRCRCNAEPVFDDIQGPTFEQELQAALPPGYVGLADMLADLGIDPKAARGFLRKTNIEKPEVGWGWKPEEANRIKELLAKKFGKALPLKPELPQQPPPPLPEKPKRPRKPKQPPVQFQPPPPPPAPVEVKGRGVPRGSPIVASEMRAVADASTKLEVGRASWDEQKAIRKHHSDKLAEYKFPNRDTDLAGERIKVEPKSALGNADAYHTNRGLISLSNEMARDLDAFYKDMAAGRNYGQEVEELKVKVREFAAQGRGMDKDTRDRLLEITNRAYAYRVMTHEAIHGHGPRFEYQGDGVFVEEVVTESAARRVTRDVTGVQLDRLTHLTSGDGAYGRWINGARDSILNAGLTKKPTLTKQEAYLALEDAAIRYKTETEGVFKEDAVDRLVDKIDVEALVGQSLTLVQRVKIKEEIAIRMKMAAKVDP